MSAPPAPAPAIAAADRTSLPARFAFLAGDLSMNFYWSGTGLFLMYYYTDVLGVEPVVAGAVYALALVWDAVTDPLMGVVADRTRTRLGRYRPWILAGALPLGASYALAFWNPGLSGAALIVWIAFTHCLLRTTYTVVGVPLSSMQARLTADARERAVLAGYRMMGAATGALTVAIATPGIVAALGQGDEARGYLLAAIGAGALGTVIQIVCALVMREPVPDADAAPPGLAGPIAELATFGQILRENTPLLRVFAVITVISIALTMFGKNVLYYFKYQLEAPQSTQLALAMPGFAMIVAVPVWVWIANKTSKRTAWMAGAAIAATGYGAFYLNPVETVPVVTAIIALISLGGAAFAVLFWSMLPDTVEWGEAHAGVRHEARVFGFASFAQKAALGINAVLLGWLLTSVGYQANTGLSQATLDGIKAMMALIPLAGVLASVAILWGYPIDARRHAQLRAVIARRSGQTAEQEPMGAAR